MKEKDEKSVTMFAVVPASEIIGKMDDSGRVPDLLALRAPGMPGKGHIWPRDKM